MPQVTIHVSEDAANMIELMMKQYALQTGRPTPTLQAAVATFFVAGFRDSVRFSNDGPPEGFKFGEWVPRELAEKNDAS